MSKPATPRSKVDRKVALLEKHFILFTGRKFSIKGREWVRDLYFRALDGFRLWPKETPEGRDPKPLCPDCLDRAGMLVDSFWYDVSCEGFDCRGLETRPILYIVIKLERRGGKTTNALSYALATALMEKNVVAMYLATGEDQTKEIFKDNVKTPLDSSPALGERFVFAGHRLTSRDTGSSIEIAATSGKRLTGRGKSLLLVDECRDIAAETVMKLLPALWAEHGWNCPNGHVRFAGEATVPNCSVCGTRLEPWRAKAVLMSSAGVLKDEKRDWFASLVELLKSEPDPDFLLIDLTDPNPETDVKSRDAFVRVFGAVPALRAFVHAEAGSEFLRPGDDFLTLAELKTIEYQSETHRQGSDLPAIMMLDTSVSRDLTTLAFAVWDQPKCGPKDRPWWHLHVPFVRVWNPATDFPEKVIDERAIEEALDAALARFPNLLGAWVDTRGSRVLWAQTLVARRSRDRIRRRRLLPFAWGGKEKIVRSAGWYDLLQRAHSKRISVPNMPRLREEIQGLRAWFDKDGVFHVEDRNPDKMHADVSQTISNLCYLAFREAERIQQRPQDPKERNRVLQTLQAGANLREKYNKQ